MNAEQAWQSVLGQLQMEMPRASFDTWVRDTKPVSYQDETLTIGVRNAYARDWLESRLASTVSRLLVGTLNANASVQFVVADGEHTSRSEQVLDLQTKWEKLIQKLENEQRSYDEAIASARRDGTVQHPKQYVPVADVRMLSRARVVSFDGKTLALETDLNSVEEHILERTAALSPYLLEIFGDSLEDLDVTTCKAGNAEQAWQSVLGQLQLEMPKASFDTWVRDTKPVSYQDGTLTIGVRNAYARDWLESRLASMISRLLTGILGTGATVEFVVDGEETGDRRDGGDENENKELARVGDATWFELTARYTSLYDAIVDTNATVPLNAYFLRFLPRTGPEVGCLYFAFRQVSFLLTSRSSGTISERFHIDALVDWCGGMSRRTVQKYLMDPETWKKLDGLVRRESTEKEWAIEDSGVRRLPVKYTVELTLPLTPADAESLTSWFRARLIEGKSPHDILELVLEVANTKDGNVEIGLEELIPLANNYNSTSEYPPMTVNAVLQSVFGELVPEKTLIAYAVRLEKLIMPSKDLVMVSHFFAKNIWPHLNPGPGWLVVIGKDKTFKGKRDTVVVEGGFREMARWLGLSEKHGGGTVGEWFTEKYTEKRLKSYTKTVAKKKGRAEPKKGGREKQAKIGDLRHAIMHVYLSVVNEVRRFGGSTLTIRVFQEDLPFEIFDAALCGGMKGVEYLAQRIMEFDPEKEPTQEDSPFILTREDGSICAINVGRFALSNEVDLHQQLGSIRTIGLGRFASTDRSICTNSMGRFVLSVGSICAALISLNSESTSKENSVKTITNSLQQPDAGSSQLSVPNVWNLETLLKIGRVKKEDRKTFFHKYNKSHLWHFLTRLLYAVGPQGNGIKSPAYWAISRMDDDEFDLPEYKALAKLSPNVLVMLAYKTAQKQSLVMDPALIDYAHLWMNAMGNNSLVGERVLTTLLGKSPISTEFERVVTMVSEPEE
jgi:hypothetical protein